MQQHRWHLWHLKEGIYWANDILSEDIMEDYRKKCTEKGIYCGWQFNEEYEL